MSVPVVTLLTDFGLYDAYAGVMKGVILGLGPESRIVDLTHGIRMGGIRQAAFVLGVSFGFFPGGTVHVAVVDPGVGSGRRILAASARDHFFLAPDNGLLPAALEIRGRLDGPSEACWHSVEARDLYLEEVSSTFQGRDIFAPVAAALARNRNPGDLGPRIEDPARIALNWPRAAGGTITGAVQYVDGFGNAVTNLRMSDVDFEDWRIEIGGRSVRGPVDSYSEALPGEPVFLEGSHGFIEIASGGASAAAILGISEDSGFRAVPAGPL